MDLRGRWIPLVRSAVVLDSDNPVGLLVDVGHETCAISMRGHRIDEVVTYQVQAPH